MSYFDSTSDEDKKLLHADIRDHAELGNVADDAELDVLLRFSVDGVVNLTGYTEEPDDAAITFKKAFKKSVADLITYRLRTYDREPDLASEKRGNRSESYRDDERMKSVPDHTVSRLFTFEKSEIVYSL